jgi:hypothetical protein
MIRAHMSNGNRGRKEWTGDWSDASPLWTRRMKAKITYNDKDDGTFWMSWDVC